MEPYGMYAAFAPPAKRNELIPPQPYPPMIYAHERTPALDDTISYFQNAQYPYEDNPYQDDQNPGPRNYFTPGKIRQNAVNLLRRSDLIPPTQYIMENNNQQQMFGSGPILSYRRTNRGGEAPPPRRSQRLSNAPGAYRGGTDSDQYDNAQLTGIYDAIRSNPYDYLHHNMKDRYPSRYS